MDLVPRITTFDTPPIPEEEALILTPATFPLKELTKFTSLLVVMSSAFTCCTLYDKAFSERLIPNAVTTTSSSTSVSSFIVMSITFLPATDISTVWYPT